MALTIVANTKKRISAGSEMKVTCNLAFDSSYPTGGESYASLPLGLSTISRVKMQSEGGYEFSVDYANQKIKVFQIGANTTAGTSGGTPAGTNASSTALDVATPVFSGTGQTSAGQVITTTDNQTMTLNQCAGMWFVSATHGPYLIASNTAVTGAPAVLTIYGTAPTTDAGTYRIYKNVAQTFTGTALGTHTHATVAGASSEVPNTTDLSVLSSVEVEFYGI